MKKMNKKGFTIVELVIVIAVIAVLAGVMIPTFTGVIANANEKAALQTATNAYKEAYAAALLDDGAIENNDSEEINGFTFTWTVDANGAITAIAVEEPDDFGYTVAVSAAGVVTVTKA